VQLKIKRTQREGGVVSKTMIFCIDAMVHFTPEEAASLKRYKLGNQVIYNSEASARLLDRSANAQGDGKSLAGNFKSLALAALAGMKLNISINSLAAGQHVECKSLDELIGAENAIMEACENLRMYLATAATFDGRELLFDFANGEGTLVAQATPSPMLVVPPAAPTPAIPAPAAIEHSPGGLDLPPPMAAHQASSQAVTYSPSVEAANNLEDTMDRVSEWMTPKRLFLIISGVVLFFMLFTCGHHG
jgi:hypothetical protein